MSQRFTPQFRLRNRVHVATKKTFASLEIFVTLVTLLTLPLLSTTGFASPTPVRYNAFTNARNFNSTELDSAWVKIELALKRYERPGAQPVLLVHGLAQNDRIWDSRIERFSFAKALYDAGYDVWIGNLRNAGTDGFRSDGFKTGSPWSVEDYGISDLPSLIKTVTEATHQKPFFIGHSLAAWAIEAYLSGLQFDRSGALQYSESAARENTKTISGIISIAGAYSLSWPVSFPSVISSSEEFYQSNYEFEIASKIPGVFWGVRQLSEIPLDWVESLVNLPLEQVPVIGSMLEKWYGDLEESITRTPLLSLFFYSKNSNLEMVKEHAKDGMESMAPKLIEQLANSLIDQEPRTYFKRSLFPFIHAEAKREECFSYADLRKANRLPILFIGGEKDRLANVEMIYHEGYLKSKSPDKTFIRVKDSGHLDIITGNLAKTQVLTPIIRWLGSHSSH